MQFLLNKINIYVSFKNNFFNFNNCTFLHTSFSVSKYVDSSNQFNNKNIKQEKNT